jgi:octaprenyl-diphosphate synthase
MIQTQRRYDLNLSIPDYFRIIEMKTAALFAAAGELGAFLNGASPEIMLACKTFGLRLGTAYQVYDDCLDLAGSEEKAGKSLGSDLRKGKLTLPVLYLLQTASRQEHHRFGQALLHSETEDVSWLENEVVRRGCLRRSVEKTKELIADAQQEIMKVGVNRYTLALQEIGDFLANTADQFAAAA